MSNETIKPRQIIIDAVFHVEPMGNGWTIRESQGFYTRSGAEAAVRLANSAPELLEALEAAQVALELSDQDRFDGRKLSIMITKAIRKATKP